MKTVPFGLLLCLAFINVACVSGKPDAAQPDAAQPDAAQPDADQPSATHPVRFECPSVRPQICTMDYRPVCATRDNGIRCVTTPCHSTETHSYANGCSACADPTVIDYVDKACDN